MKTETVEEFLARGGRVEKIPAGVSSCMLPPFKMWPHSFRSICGPRDGGRYINFTDGGIHHRPLPPAE